MSRQMPVIYDEAFLEHQTGSFHPENPGRLTAIVQALQASPWAERLMWRSPTPVAERELLPLLLHVHAADYVAAVAAAAAAGGGHLDADTVVSTNSYDVALLAVSAWLDGVDWVYQTGQPVFVLARPPGHHALKASSMGFCLFANAAIAARYGLQQPGIDRVAILDWDVHHGNGTQALVESHPQIVYCSLHQAPFYPGTGAAQETGAFQNVLNIPLPSGSWRSTYERAFEQQVMPFLSRFRPDLLIVSAGYDANRDDPLAEMLLKPEDFGWLTQQVLSLTRHVVFGLEGGYDYASLGASVVATVGAVVGP